MNQAAGRIFSPNGVFPYRVTELFLRSDIIGITILPDNHDIALSFKWCLFPIIESNSNALIMYF
jgi:hypothetical protein